MDLGLETHPNIDDHPNKEIFDAWIAKFEQCYDKAKLTFLQDSDFSQIQSIYTRTIRVCF